MYGVYLFIMIYYTMTIYLATGNKHKKEEMSQICKDHIIRIPSDENIAFNPEETGETFIENSLIKAKALWEIVKKPVLADDSGICVDMLNGVPGVYSARYEGISYPRGKKQTNSHLTQSEQNRLLLEHVNEVQSKDNTNPRTCYYVCAMVFYYGKDKFICVQETMEGILVNNMQESCGTGGFGYDPIVILPEYNKTVAELTEDEKNTVSHRGKAMRKILQHLDTI